VQTHRTNFIKAVRRSRSVILLTITLAGTIRQAGRRGYAIGRPTWWRQEKRTSRKTWRQTFHEDLQKREKPVGVVLAEWLSE